MTEEKLRELLNSMSLEEKVGQMLQLAGNFYEDGKNLLTGPLVELGITEEDVWKAGSVLSLTGADTLKKLQKEYMEKQPHHIPLLFMADIINGYKTVFPIPLAQGCSFNPGMVEKGAEIAARESAAAGIHITFSPMADLVRDARWGRVMESTGEDTYLNSLMAEAMVKGYQGDDVKKKGRIGACVKHFAGYGAPNAGRDYNTVELSDSSFFNDYLPAYEAAVHAGALLVMTSFNTLDGIPSTANQKLLEDILRKQMGFNGVIISDWCAVEELLNHGIASSKKEAAELAVRAGVDIEMMSGCYLKELASLLEEYPEIKEAVDRAVYRILVLKNKLGLFENPYKDADVLEEERIIRCLEFRKIARKAAAETFVLLKNEDAMLPLNLADEQIAFIGPYVDSKSVTGAWSIFSDEDINVTIREGILNAMGKSYTAFAKGCTMLDPETVIPEAEDKNLALEKGENNEELLKDAIELAKHASKVVLTLGEHKEQSGEGGSRGKLILPDVQMNLLREVCKVNDNVTVVVFCGRPLELKEVVKLAKAVMVVWFPGTESGNAIADVLYGKSEPGGRLSMSLPECVGQLPMTYKEFFTGRPYGKENKMLKRVSRYLDIPNQPLFPFGYGLTYTSFSYSDLQLLIQPDNTICASIAVTNTGSRIGTETVQLYVRDVTGSIVRPVKELKGFEKVTLEPEQSKIIKFVINKKMLEFYTRQKKWETEDGEFHIFIGKDSSIEEYQKIWLKDGKFILE